VDGDVTSLKTNSMSSGAHANRSTMIAATATMNTQRPKLSGGR
jgi:hypothetical protein